MEKLLNEKVSGIFAESDAIYFCKKLLNDYQFFKHDLKKVKKIHQDTYLNCRFGPAYKKIAAHYGLDCCIDLSAAKCKDGSIITNYYQDSFVYSFDNKGNILWKKEDMFFDTIYSLAVKEYSLWCAYPTNHTIICYSLETFQEVKSIGGGEPLGGQAEMFNLPEDIFINGNTMYVSDMGNHRVCQIDLTTDNIQTYHTFDEPVWGYWQMNEQEFVLLNSGLYRL